MPPEHSDDPVASDDHGFVDLGALDQAARRCSLADFAAAYPFPALLIELASGREDRAGSGAEQGRNLVTVSVRSVDFLAYVGRVGFLVKRPGNPFPRMISLGRTSSMDLVLDVRSISKFHGYFEEAGGRWHYVDHDSTNGSRLNGQRLEPGERYPLAAEDRLRFGLDVEAVFLPAAHLYRRLVGGREAD